MGTSIQDPSTGKSVAVTSDFHMKTAGRADARLQFEANQRRAFNINPGFITLTTDSASGLLYVKNELGSGGDNVVVSSVVINTQASTSGVGVGTFEVIRNPTTGTLISSGTAANVRNYNTGGQDFGTSTITALYGAEGSTVTNGDSGWPIGIVLASARTVLSLPIVLEPGGAMAIKITPPTSNTSWPVDIAYVGYLEAPES